MALEVSDFSSLLQIILAILAVIFTGGMVGVYKFLSDRLQKEAESKAHKSIQKQVARLFNHMGYMYWIDFKGTNYQNMEELKLAIDLAERALKIFHELNELDDELVYAIKNNLAYYLAKAKNTSVHKAGNDKLAKSYAEEIYNKISRFPEKRDHWTDTYNFVNQEFS